MPELALSVTVSRGLLGLADLDINDHVIYAVSPDFLGSMVTWKRTSVGSPFVDGEVEVFRSRGNVQETIGIEVDGDGTDLKANCDALTTALMQDHYTLTAASSAGTWQYLCFAADYQGQLSGPRLIFGRLKMMYQIPRHPVALSGVI